MKMAQTREEGKLVLRCSNLNALATAHANTSAAATTEKQHLFVCFLRETRRDVTTNFSFFEDKIIIIVQIVQTTIRSAQWNQPGIKCSIGQSRLRCPTRRLELV